MQLTTLPVSEEFEHDLLKRVRRFLHQRGYAIFRTLKISIERDVVVVQGRLPSFYLRQTAIECVKRVPGARQVIDKLQVDPCKGCGAQSQGQSLPNASDDELRRRDDRAQVLRRSHGEAAFSLYDSEAALTASRSKELSR